MYLCVYVFFENIFLCIYIYMYVYIYIYVYIYTYNYTSPTWDSVSMASWARPGLAQAPLGPAGPALIKYRTSSPPNLAV